MNTIVRAAPLCLAMLMAGCAFKPQKLLASYETLEVHEVRRSLQCQSVDEGARVQIFPGPAAVIQWTRSRGLEWNAPAPLPEAPYALVEMGLHPTGGYGLAVSRSAVLRGGLLILTATFVTPAEGRMVTQALTSPCVLVRLPEGRYGSVEVQDQTGSVRASGGLFEPQAPTESVPVPAAEPESDPAPESMPEQEPGPAGALGSTSH